GLAGRPGPPRPHPAAQRRRPTVHSIPEARTRPARSGGRQAPGHGRLVKADQPFSSGTAAAPAATQDGAPMARRLRTPAAYPEAPHRQIAKSRKDISSVSQYLVKLALAHSMPDKQEQEQEANEKTSRQYRPCCPGPFYVAPCVGRHRQAMQNLLDGGKARLRGGRRG